MGIEQSLTILTSLAVLSVAFPTAAGPVYQWADRHGQSHYSDTPPGEPYTFARGSAAPHPTPSNRAGLRHGERRILDRLDRQAARRHEAGKSRGRKAHQHRTRSLEACRQLRKRWRGTRDDVLRKQYARELRQRCW